MRLAPLSLHRHSTKITRPATKAGDGRKTGTPIRAAHAPIPRSSSLSTGEFSFISTLAVLKATCFALCDL
jgi:hypothetical protein